VDKVDLAQKLSLFADHWNPRIIAELNGQHVKLARLLGPFTWHHHENEDELFLVLKGTLQMQFPDRTLVLEPGQLVVVPRGVEHRPVAEQEVEVLLFEPATTVNTGSATGDDRTRTQLERL
jgi:mannose-6-phosphate isomerase-like protein (cupin superfamily)